jgi:hypothetical protein
VQRALGSETAEELRRKAVAEAGKQVARQAAAEVAAAADRLLAEAEQDIAAAEARRAGRAGVPDTSLPEWASRVTEREAAARAALRGAAPASSGAAPPVDREAKARAELEELKKKLGR